ncbi:hypothetical protein AHAS_Ahas01G0277900 [Arachis hypogaea]
MAEEEGKEKAITAMKSCGQSRERRERSAHGFEQCVGIEVAVVVVNSGGWISGENSNSTPNEQYCWMRLKDIDYPRAVTECHQGCSDLAAEMAAALAVASIVFKDDKSYAEKLVHGATTLFKFSRDGRGKFSAAGSKAGRLYNSTSYWDEFIWGGAWMYYATGNSLYLKLATTPDIAKYAGAFRGSPNYGVLSCDNKFSAAQSSKSQLSSDDIGEWLPPQPSLIPGGGMRGNHGERLKLDLSSTQMNNDRNCNNDSNSSDNNNSCNNNGVSGLLKRNRIAFFDKECSKVAEHVYLGGDAVAKNRDILKQNGITQILNCVGFVCLEYFKADFVYRTLWLQDSSSEDITSILYDVFDYFEDVRKQGGRVFVHCCQGVSRSTSLVIAYLMWREGQSFDDAFQLVNAARGITDPNMGKVESFKSSAKVRPGERKVGSYDVDYEIFQKAIIGGFVPPFPSSEDEHETHLSARESSWSALRRKVSSSHMKEIVTVPKGDSIPKNNVKYSCTGGWKWRNTSNPNPNTIVGAMVAGPDKFDGFHDVRTNYNYTRPTLAGNAGLVAALVALSAHHDAKTTSATVIDKNTFSAIPPMFPTPQPPPAPWKP